MMGEAEKERVELGRSSSYLDAARLEQRETSVRRVGESWGPRMHLQCTPSLQRRKRMVSLDRALILHHGQSNYHDYAHTLEWWENSQRGDDFQPAVATLTTLLPVANRWK